MWAIALCFAVLTGTAVAAGSGGDGPKATTAAASATKQIKKLKRKVNGLEDRLAAVEGSQSPRPPTGPAGGELAGTYPNPLIGTVRGLDIASATSPTSGINFLPDPVVGGGTNLYRSQPGELKTDNTFIAGNVISEVDMLVGRYLRLNRVTAAPLTADCDQSFEVGRVVFNTSDNKLYVCIQGPPIAWKTLTPA